MKDLMNSLEAARALLIEHKAQRAPQRTREVSVTATQAKKEFGAILERAIQGGAVVITKHDAPKAVLISIDEFLARTPESKINSLSAEFDALFARLQRPGARFSMQAAFDASPTQLGKAARAAARKRG